MIEYGESYLAQNEASLAILRQGMSKEAYQFAMEMAAEIAHEEHGDMTTKDILYNGAKALFEHEMRCRDVEGRWANLDAEERKKWEESVLVVLAATDPRNVGNAA